MQTFISEDDFTSFEGWLRYQAVDPATIALEELEALRRVFDEGRERSLVIPKVGLVKLKPIPGKYRYAVAVRDDSGLWLTLWVKRSPRGEFFVMLPRSDPKWNVHTSYHLDGRLHMKSYGHKTVETNCQPLTGVFRGTQSLGMYGGHGPKGIGAICDPKAFSGVVEVGPGVLGPIHGTVAVDLVEPGHEPMAFPGKIVTEQTFRDIVPWLVIRAGPLSAKPMYKKIKGCGERADTKDALDFSAMTQNCAATLIQPKTCAGQVSTPSSLESASSASVKPAALSSASYGESGSALPSYPLATRAALW